MHGLLISASSIEHIFDNCRIWEIRTKPTRIRGTIGLIQSGTSTVIGICELVDCVGPLSLAEMRRNVDKHNIPLKHLRKWEGDSRNLYAWVLVNARRLKKPVSYHHKIGINTWHPLPNYVASRSPLVLRGRYFSPANLETILQCVQNHFGEGRTQISEIICKKLKWRQPNGWLKDRACRDVLLQLEKTGLISLPQVQIHRTASKNQPKTKYLAEYDLTSTITGFPEQLTLEFAKSNVAEKVWNEVVDQFHYLGHKVTVGRCIKYLVKAEEVLLGALSFSSPAWSLQVRDHLLNSIGIDPSNLKDSVINNSRFLILPNVQVPNLASMILSLATSKVTEDWKDYYSITPQIVETFVQPSRYLGTCYKAANWIEVGLTKGYAKRGSAYQNSQEPKQIFLYGLNKSIRRKLLKAVEEMRLEDAELEEV